MKSRSTLATLSLSVCLSFLACSPHDDGRQPPNGNNMNPNDMGSTTVTNDMAADPYSWGEATPGVTSGPFGDLKLFRNGCGTELFARFIARQDFGLLETVTTTPKGLREDVGYIEVPQYVDKQKVVLPLYTNGGTDTFSMGSYQNDFSVGYPAGTKLTHSFAATPDNGMYRSPGQLTFVSQRMAGSSLYITVQSTLNGHLYICALYDANDCFVTNIGYSDTAVPLVKGQPTEFQCAYNAQAGKHYLIVLEGQDGDTKFPFYTTMNQP